MIVHCGHCSYGCHSRLAGINMSNRLTKEHEYCLFFVMPEGSNRASMFHKMDSRLRGNDGFLEPISGAMTKNNDYF